jgi:hypothetical protein
MAQSASYTVPHGSCTVHMAPIWRMLPLCGVMHLPYLYMALIWLPDGTCGSHAANAGSQMAPKWHKGLLYGAIRLTYGTHATHLV